MKEEEKRKRRKVRNEESSLYRIEPSGEVSYCLRGDRERERERVLERLRLLLLLFLPIFTSFLKLQGKRTGELVEKYKGGGERERESCLTRCADFW